MGRPIRQRKNMERRTEMMEHLSETDNGRKKREREELLAEYPGFSPFAMLKLSMIRYGAVLTKKAEKKILQKGLSFGTDENFGLSFGDSEENAVVPGPILLRDSTFVYINYGENYADPYGIDFDDGADAFVLTEQTDGGGIVDEIGFVPPPAFYAKKTSRGTPMRQIADVRAQKLILNAFQKCCFWKDRRQCAFCAFFTAGGKTHVLHEEDVRETVREALAEPGRFSEIYLSGGTDTSGKEPFANEKDRYIRILRAAGESFKGRFPSQLMAPAYPKSFLQEIYDATGVRSYSADIEIASPELFAKYCPGKQETVGYETWMQRLVDAVDVFGRGNVYSQVVTGAELAGPDGLSEKEGFESSVKACEYLAERGVILLSTIWRPHRAARLGLAEMPPLSYFVKIADAFHKIHQKYGLRTTDDDYKHCGNHPDADLERTDPEPDEKVIIGSGPVPYAAVMNRKPAGQTILLGLAREYSGAGSLLNRGMQENRLVTAVMEGREIPVLPYRCHITGPVWENMLKKIREKDPGADISCVFELTVPPDGASGLAELIVPSDGASELAESTVPSNETPGLVEEGGLPRSEEKACSSLDWNLIGLIRENTSVKEDVPLAEAHLDHPMFHV